MWNFFILKHFFVRPSVQILQLRRMDISLSLGRLRFGALSAKHLIVLLVSSCAYIRFLFSNKLLSMFIDYYPLESIRISGSLDIVDIYLVFILYPDCHLVFTTC